MLNTDEEERVDVRAWTKTIDVWNITFVNSAIQNADAMSRLTILLLAKSFQANARFSDLFSKLNIYFVCFQKKKIENNNNWIEKLKSYINRIKLNCLKMILKTKKLNWNNE